MSPPPLIRPAEKRDLDTLLALSRRLSDEGHQADPRYRVITFDEAATRRHAAEDWFHASRPFPYAWVAANGHDIQGILTGRVVPVHPLLETLPTARIDALYVLPDARRTGLGRALVRAFCEAAAGAGFPRHSVHTLSLDSSAVNFWRAIGFLDLFTELVSEPVEKT